MKSLYGVALTAGVLGAVLGGLMGYYEAGVSPNFPTSGPGGAESDDTTHAQGPAAEIPETVFHFDRIERGTSMDHTFKIRNVGDQSLNVKVVSTTCKCTAGDLTKDRIAPGDEAEIELEWTAKTPPGPFRHGATLSTNDPKHSRIELIVEGEVVESSTLQPAELLFGTVNVGESKETSLYLISNLQEDVEVLDHELSADDVADHIQLSFERLNKQQLKKDDFPDPKALGALRVTAKFQAGKEMGPFFSWLTLHTNLDQAKKLSIPISGNVVGDISVFGPGWIAQSNLLRIGAVQSAEGKKVRLLLAVRGEHAQDTQLTVARVDPPELHVSLGEAKTMKEDLVHIPLVVEIPAKTRPMVRMTRPTDDEDTAHGDGEIVLNSTHPDTTEVRLKIRFSVE